ncbi:hypothetical protein D7D52_23295 [Nocardia yunnanensis]|uniref:Uncharacterized protein n=1 Tax=Nocardia yunnanensis TaxID=2382165 RepID=A0A386ZFQ3_9NOCA|nr:hypothetical protein [Nocardia yunnanensis]AYF76266.1 hypothetical protein D7D52_23295 [Nocardia yunnanensis]
MKRVLASAGIATVALLAAAPLASADSPDDLFGPHDWSSRFAAQDNLILSSRILISPYGTSHPLICSGGDGHYSLFPHDCTQTDDNGVAHTVDRAIPFGDGGVYIYR